MEILLFCTFLILGIGLIILRKNLLTKSKTNQRHSNFASFPQGFLSAPQLLAWIDEATQGWLIVSPDLKILYINNKAERLLQLSEHTLVRGKDLEEVLSFSQFEEAISSCRRLLRPQRCQWEKNGEPLEASLIPGADSLLLILLQSRRSIEAQQQEQARWVSDVAHELKTPLTSLVLVSDRLENSIKQSDSFLVHRLKKELSRLQVLVSDLLELSRLENCLPMETTKYSTISLAELVEQGWNTIKPIADKRNISISIKKKESGNLLGDHARLQRAIINLLDNSLRYSPEYSSIDVEILPSGGWWILNIRDHGPGLSRSDLDNMFQRFYRGDPSRARSSRTGSGLGLSIVQQIVINHGGRIQARNHEQGGAIMELLLPKGNN